LHAAHPENAAVAHAEPAKIEAPAAVVEVNAAAAEPAAAIAPVAAEAAAKAAAAAPSDDGEVEDDSPSTDSAPAERAEMAPAKADKSAIGEAAIAEAHRLTALGNKIKALNVLRHAAKKVPTDAKVLQELASTAEENRAWGEATRAARHWVAVEPSIDSKLELARLERKTGHRDRALELVRSVVKDNPDSPEAHAMLSQLGGTERVALQK
jgi:tetratricopeptide (TPR) repeat protein